jgi:DNA-binding transcriptional ArsR family regulator
MNNETAAIDDVLVALSDPTRRAIVELLVRQSYRAGDLARETGTSRSRMSKHLRVLMDAGVARDERTDEDARARVFHLRPESIERVRSWADQLQGEWDRQLQSFKEHVENRSKQNE